MPTPDPKSEIRDNDARGSVGDFPGEHLNAEADMDYAFEPITWLMLPAPSPVTR